MQQLVDGQHVVAQRLSGSSSPIPTRQAITTCSEDGIILLNAGWRDAALRQQEH